MIVVLLLFAATSAVDSTARQSGQGRVVRPHWPDMAYEAGGSMVVPFARSAEQYTDVDLLAVVDSLVLTYDWEIADEIPRLSFGLSWTRGIGGILDGRPVSDDEMPQHVELRLVDLHAEVFVAGRHAGDLVLALDSLALPPDSMEYTFEAASVAWDSLFTGMDETATREAFRAGFELRNLDILRIGFDGYDFDPGLEPEDRVVRRVPTRGTVFVPDPTIWIEWTIGSNVSRPQARGTRTEGRTRRGTSGSGNSDGSRTSSRRPRGSGTGTVGADAGRTVRDTRRSGGDAVAGAVRDATRGGSSRDDDDDDKKRDLGTEALVGAAAVAALVLIGGSVGLSGWSDSPIGVTGGRITAKGGLLLHVAASQDVFEGGNDETVRFGVTGYYGKVARYIIPGAGLGFRMYEDRGAIRSAPMVEIGAAFRWKRLFVIGGIDAVSGAGRFGLVVALRDPDRD